MGNRRFAMATRWLMALLMAAIAMAGNAFATLIVEPDGVVLDTNTGLEWEQNITPGFFYYSEGAGSPGALEYAANLALDGGGWHLPLLGEFQGLYDDLISAGVCAAANCSGSIGGFNGIGDGFWMREDANGVGRFYFAGGFHVYYGFDGFEFNTHGVWVARPDDRDSAVPEPASLALLGVGLAALGFSRRKPRMGRLSVGD